MEEFYCNVEILEIARLQLILINGIRVCSAAAGTNLLVLDIIKKVSCGSCFLISYYLVYVVNCQQRAAINKKLHDKLRFEKQAYTNYFSMDPNICPKRLAVLILNCAIYWDTPSYMTVISTKYTRSNTREAVDRQLSFS